MKNIESRQSFLGADSAEQLRRLRVGVIGLSGGGSHVCQQLAHLGVGHFLPIDPQVVDAEGTNLNRLVGATRQDVLDKTPKAQIAKRLILGIRPDAHVDARESTWQSCGDSLRDCDVIFGCVDSYRDRAELERAARRYLIPYIDIGMEVRKAHVGYHISGQVIVSRPGGPCMWCLGFLREDLLAVEANRYGDAGPQQQVVWPNGLLASTAVGLLVQLISPWRPTPTPLVFEYDGDLHTLVPGSRTTLLAGHRCEHFGSNDLGDPFFRSLLDHAGG